ncbi:MAG: N-acetylmuramoyl-L-alanine amidase [Anaerolineales bacterium]|nr:N-acetylmuramoyl-L-alanine amidase [Anaerolineales bacterium]
MTQLRKRLTRLMAIFLLSLGIFAVAEPAIQADEPVEAGQTKLEVVRYDNLDLTQLTRSEEGLYVSEVIDAPFAFNALVPEWTTAVSGFYLEIRTGQNGTWSDWTAIHTDHDASLPEDEMQVGNMIFVTAVESTHTQVQFRTYSHSREIERLQFTYIDSTHGPTSEDLLARQAQGEFDTPTPADAVPGGYPKPGVIPRSVWCTDYGCACPPGGCGNACLDSDPLVYRNVTHLIVHHTVSSNNSADWAAVMRAIWNFHALGRCWGDIGYNYLIDMNGLIYEGHRGGDDVVGTHAAGGNYYSMGVSLIGTFTEPTHSIPGIRPPEPMQNSLAELLAWKASQREIDIYSASYHAGLEAGRPHLMGHRDAYGTTTCPGQQAHDLLPEIKDRVATKLNFTPDHRYIDELSPQFSRSASNWQVGPYTCGNNSHTYYTQSTNNPGASSFWGEWRFNVPYAGGYEIEVYTPYCNTGASETNSARYTIYHAGGQSTAVVNQNNRVGLYTPLGEFDLSPNSDHRLRLTDLTQDSGNAVWFDTIRLRYLGPAVVASNPTAESWQTNRTVSFNWGVSNAPSVGETRLRVATDAGMNNLVHQAAFGDQRTSASHTFGQDYANLYWQVSVDTAVGTITSAPVRFSLDSTPPDSAVDRIDWNAERTGYILNWSGTDTLSGLQDYRIEYRKIGTSSWFVLFDDTTQTSTNVIPTSLNDGYEFRSMATDKAGNTEPAPANPDISTNNLTSLLSLVSPAEGEWVRSQAVQLKWDVMHTNAPNQMVTVQVATDSNFASLLSEKTVTAVDEQITINVNGDYARLYWRLLESSQPGRTAQVIGSSYFGVDTTPPKASISAIYRVYGGNYVVALASQEALSGVAEYALQFRELGTGTWQNYPAPIRSESVLFAPSKPTAVYELRVRAADNAGNVAAWSDEGVRNTAVAVVLDAYTFLPITGR